MPRAGPSKHLPTFDAPRSHYSWMFRLSSRSGLSPLIAASRNTLFPQDLFQSLLQNRSFSQSLFLRNSGFEDTRHSRDGSPRSVPDVKAHCPCCAQWSAIRMVQAPVASGSPFWDAALTALMGIGFGEPIFQTARAHMFSEPRSGISLFIIALP